MADRVERAGPAPRPAVPAVRPVSAPAGATDRAGLLGLQRTAGNGAVAGLVGGAVASRAGARAAPSVQRDDGPPGEGAVAKALRTRDPSDVKAIDRRELAGLPAATTMELVRILAYQGWVGPFDELRIEELWGSLSTEELVRTGSREVTLFNHCLDVGASLDRLANVKLMAGDFVSDTRAVALGYLRQNGDLVRSQLAALGIPAKADAAAPPPTEAQASALAAAQRAAASVADLQKQMEAAQRLPVGYAPATSVPMRGDSAGGPAGDDGTGPGTAADSGGGPGTPDRRRYAEVAAFRPGSPPPFARAEDAVGAGFTLTGPTVETKDFTTLDTVFARAGASVTALLGLHPAVMALTRTGKADDVGAFAAEQDPAAARARLGAAMRGVLDAVAKAEAGLQVGAGAIDPLDLQPIHRQLFAGQVRATGEGKGRYDWSQSLPRLVAEKQVGEHEFGKVLAHLGLGTLSAAAFLVAPFTGGASLAVVLAVGVGAAATNAVVSNQEYDRLLSLSRAAVKPGTELVDQGQVDAAKAQKDADEAELALAVFTAATLGLGQIGRYKALAKAVETSADAVGLAETLMELTSMLESDVAMRVSRLDIDLPAGAPVQRQVVDNRAVWEHFEIHAAGQLQAGAVPGIPPMDIVLPGVHNRSGNGVDRIGLRRTRSGRIEVWHFEVKWNYLETSNPDPKLWERGGRIQFDADWEAKAIQKLCDSDHPSALAARDAVRQYLASTSGRKVGNVPMSEVLDVLRTRSRGRAVLVREGVVPATLLDQLARLLRRGRRIRLGKVRLP